MESPLNSFLNILAGLLILVVGVLFAVPHFVEWNNYRHVFEAHASKLIGRTVKVDGSVSMRLLPVPFMRFQKVRIADLKRGGIQNPFLEADDFTIWLSISPLLRGTVVAKEIEITRPEIRLDVQKNGTGNWHGIGNPNANVPFMPKEVALNSVKITDGRLLFRQIGSKKTFTLNDFNGTLSAGTLEGPYKFTGHVNGQGKRREIRLSTGRWQKGGVMRVKSVVQITQSGNVYTFDGHLSTPNKAPRLTGELTAEIPIGKDIRPVEMKAKVNASLKQAVLDDLTIAFESKNRPQNLQGKAAVDWNDGFNVNAQVQARWLDLDQSLGRGETGEGAPQEAFELFAWTLHDLAPAISRGSLQASVEQASLGGELVRNFKLRLTKTGDVFKITNMRAGLPGASELNLNGQLQAGEKGIAFSGPFSLRGSNLGLLTRWALSRREKPQAVRSEHYFAQGHLTLRPNALRVKQLRGEAAGSAFSAALHYEFGDKKNFELTLDGDRFNLVDILGPQSSPRELIKKYLDTGGQQLQKQSKRQLITNARAATIDGNSTADFLNQANARIKLRVGHLLMSGFNGRDLDADLQMKDGRLAINKLHLASEDGILIRADGQIDQSNAASKGAINFMVEAESAVALHQLGEMIALPSALLKNPKRLRTLSPLRLAGSLNTGNQTRSGFEFKVDGMAADSHISLKMHHEGRFADLGAKPLNISMTAENPKGAELIRQMASASLSKNALASSAGRLVFHGHGVPNKGVKTTLSLDAADTRFNFDGLVQMSDDGDITEMDGTVKVSSKTAAVPLALIGFGNTSNDMKDALNIRADLNKTKNTYRLSNISGRLGAGSLQGNAVVDSSSTPARIDVSMTSTEAALPTLLGFVVQWKDKSILEIASNAVANQSASFWPNQPFDKEVLKGYQGRIAVNAEKFDIGGGLKLKGGTLAAELAGGGLYLKTLKGKLHGGDFSATGQLMRANGRFKLTGAGHIKQAKLGTLTQGNQGKALARGTVNLDFSVNGEGLSPHGLISVLQGKGKLSVGQGQILRFSPYAISKLAAESMGDPKDKSPNLSTRLPQKFKDGTFPVSPFNTTFVIRDGVIRLQQIKLTAAKTDLKVKSSLELPNLKLSSDWQLLAPLPGGAEKLPPVTLAFSGPLSQFGQLTPQIDTKPLERFLTVRKIEQNVQKLEQIQKSLEKQEREEQQYWSQRQREKRQKALREDGVAARIPQEAPRIQQETLRIPQEPPRIQQETSRIPQEIPRIPQEAPRNGQGGFILPGQSNTGQPTFEQQPANTGAGQSADPLPQGVLPPTGLTENSILAPEKLPTDLLETPADAITIEQPTQRRRRPPRRKREPEPEEEFIFSD